MAAKDKSPAADGPPTFWGFLMPVLSFVGTGIGLLGFVVFFGGFVLWTRFDEIGLPADEAVWHVPKEDLVATGASFLVGAVALGLAAAAIGFAVRDLRIGKGQRARVAAASQQLAAAQLALERAQSRARTAVRDYEAKAPAVDAIVQQQSVLLQDSRLPVADQDAAVATRHAAIADMDAVKDAANSADLMVQAARAAVHDKRLALAEARELTPQQVTEQRWAGVIGIVVVTGLYLGVTGVFMLPILSIVLVVLATAVAVLAAVTVLAVTRGYGWFALSAFVGVGLVVAVTTERRTHDTVKVSPAAVVANGIPHAGFLVAESADAVYLAEPAPSVVNDRLTFADGATRLVRLDKKQVSDLVVGPLAARNAAYQRALTSLAAVCEQLKPAVPGKAGEKAGAPAPVCSTEDQKAIQARLAAIPAAPARTP